MQEENSNNFETIITTWRRMSGEKILSVSESLAGDSSNSYENFKKKEADMDLSLIEKSKVPNISVVSASPDVMVADAATNTDLLDNEEKELFTHNTKDENKEAAGDVNAKKDSNSLEGNKDNTDLLKKHSSKSQLDGLAENSVDSLDSVYLRPPPLNKTRHQEPTTEEDSCAMNCLYCVITSCDCVLM